MKLRRRAIGRGAVVGLIATIVVVSAATFVIARQANSGASTTLSPNPGGSSSCSGYPPGGDCISTYSYTFTLSLNYSGPWKLSYQGYNSMGKSNPTGVSGSYSGTGPYSIPVTLSGLDNNGLTLCAQAQKLDGSSGTLILTVTGSNETSAPFGEVSYCGGVVP